MEDGVWPLRTRFSTSIGMYSTYLLTVRDLLSVFLALPRIDTFVRCEDKVRGGGGRSAGPRNTTLMALVPSFGKSGTL